MKHHYSDLADILVSLEPAKHGMYAVTVFQDHLDTKMYDHLPTAQAAYREQVTRAKRINRRVKGGGNPKESAALYDELVAAHDGDNLDHALSYNAFKP